MDWENTSKHYASNSYSTAPSMACEVRQVDAESRGGGTTEVGRGGLRASALGWTFVKSVLFSAAVVLIVLGMAEFVTSR